MGRTHDIYCETCRCYFSPFDIDACGCCGADLTVFVWFVEREDGSPRSGPYSTQKDALVARASIEDMEAKAASWAGASWTPDTFWVRRRERQLNTNG